MSEFNDYNFFKEEDYTIVMNYYARKNIDAFMDLDFLKSMRLENLKTSDVKRFYNRLYHDIGTKMGVPKIVAKSIDDNDIPEICNLVCEVSKDSKVIIALHASKKTSN